MRKQGMHGKVNIGCLFLTFLLIVGGYTGYKFGRVYLAQYMLDRKIFEIAGAAAEDWRTRVFPSERAIADAVMQEARRHSAEVTYDDIQVSRDNKRVTINVIWEGDIVMPFYTHHFMYNFDHERKVIY